MRRKLLAVALMAIAGLAVAAPCQAHDHDTLYNYNARWRASKQPWHGPFYHAAYGAPVALVVPPNAELQTNYRWGVGGTSVTRIDHQFARPYPGDGGFGGIGFAPTPPWPSDTRQFGVYYIRGPW